MSFAFSSLATIAVAAIFITFCHVIVVAAPAATPDLDRPDEIHHRVKKRSPDGITETSSQADDEGDSEDEEEDQEENEDTGGNIGDNKLVSNGFKIVLSMPEEDPYVQNRCQTLSMFSSAPCDEDQYININDRNQILPATSQLGRGSKDGDYYSAPYMPPELYSFLQNEFSRQYIGAANQNDARVMAEPGSGLKAVLDFALRNSLYAANPSNSTKKTTTTTTERPTREGEVRDLWLVKAIDTETTPTPDSYGWALKQLGFSPMVAVTEEADLSFLKN
ncbi:uncharacterized protein LOC132200590 [Neocloeon triangulifer]|uniref:uncharacterized protein LOC132200590 n=1 Tax=Neocloeon triangulifer TaxID=2078957 RepID=UPI00286EBAD6|nr:uncharacterized protein LOC132200590 [Neocloeon triangulifer]